MSGQQARHGNEPGHPRGGRLDRAGIVDAAVDLIATEGVGALTMRRLARRLGTAPMSLYRHVDSKDELLALVVERVAEGLPTVDPGTHWEVAVRKILGGMRRVLVGHPGIGAAVTSQALFTPSALSVVEALLGALRAAGLDEVEAARVFAVLWNHTLGGVMVEQALVADAEPTADADARLAEQRRRIVGALRDMAGEDTGVRAAAGHWLDLDGDEAFQAGLDLLVAGIRARVADATP